MRSRLLYQRTANGSAEEAAPERLRELQDTSLWVWLDVIEYTADELFDLGDSLGLDPDVIEDVRDIELLPKFEDHGDHIYTVFHSLVADGDAVDTTEVDCVLWANTLITFHSIPIAGIDHLWNLTERHPTAARCNDAGTLLGRLAETIGRRYLEVLVALDRRIDELSDRALVADPTVLAEVQLMRRDESTVRMMLAPQRQLLASLVVDDTPVLSDTARRRISNAFDVHNQVVETLSTARGLLNDTLDTYRGATAEKLNEVTRVLTVYAAIMLPLTLVAGFFGMNFNNLPGTGSEYGWIVVTALMVLFGVGSWLLFERRGFVGGPNLRSVPRKAVRGLARGSKGSGT